MREEREVHLVTTVDSIAKRLRLWAGAIITTGALIAGITALAVKWVTRDVREEIATTRLELKTYWMREAAQAKADSIRFDRGMEVLELAVIALVEADGAEEQRRAVEELRRRRRYVRLNP